MKILLLGEYSGLFNNLKDGLRELGHEVSLIADPDNWKKIPGADYPLTLPYGKKNILKKIFYKLIYPLYERKLYDNYDVVLIINIDIFHPLIIHKVIKKLAKK